MTQADRLLRFLRENPGATERNREYHRRHHAKIGPARLFLRNVNGNLRRLGRPTVDECMVLPEGPCSYCGAPSQTWDHIVPLHDGGPTTPENLTPACHACNRRKNRYGVETALFRGDLLCGWCWAPVHRRLSSMTRRGRPVPWVACSQSHAMALRRWGGLAFGDPRFAGAASKLEAVA